MARSDSSFISLLAHPDTPSEAVRRLEARAERVGSDALRLSYLLEADLEHIRIPAPVTRPGRAERLWTHTCFEAFVARDSSPQYLELNFSPSGQWAAYRFDSYRKGMAPAQLPATPRITVRRGGSRLELHAELALSATLPATARAGLRIAVTSVVEDGEGRLSYWAARHPAGRPDFHHPDTFSLAL
jgi:hypothetical protein